MRELPSVKVQALATLAAIVGAVAIPQIFHVVGAISGMGTGLGEAFLPMHLPIILVGLLAGPYAGAIAGAFGPLVSFALSGMPGLAMLPFMVIELAAYGLIAGLLRTANMPTIAKVLLVQVGGRVVRAAAILFRQHDGGRRHDLDERARRSARFDPAVGPDPADHVLGRASRRQGVTPVVTSDD